MIDIVELQDCITSNTQKYFKNKITPNCLTEQIIREYNSLPPLSLRDRKEEGEHPRMTGGKQDAEQQNKASHGRFYNKLNSQYVDKEASCEWFT